MSQMKNYIDIYLILYRKSSRPCTDLGLFVQTRESRQLVQVSQMVKDGDEMPTGVALLASQSLQASQDGSPFKMARVQREGSGMING